MHHYNFKIAHYYSLDGMSWDALLKKTYINLQLLTDIDIHLFMDKRLCGGKSMVSKRLTEANNAQNLN